MKLSKARLALSVGFIALVLTTLVCATLLWSGGNAILESTLVPILGDPIAVPQIQEPEVIPDTPFPEIAPTTSPSEADPEVASIPFAQSPPEYLANLFDPFWEVWDILHEEYVDQPVDDLAMINGGIQGLLEVLEFSNGTTDSDLALEYAIAAHTPRDLQQTFVPFWQAWLNAHALDEELDDEILMRGAIHGIVASLGDQHTSYMDPHQYTQANIPLDGDYEGIGAWVDPDGEYLTIVSPMQGSPAEKAGLKPGDEIIKVDGVDMTGVNGNLVIRQVLGPAGTIVNLTVRREGTTELLEFSIVRGQITIPSVIGELLEENLAYVQLTTFGDSTSDDLHETLSELLSQNPDGLILDLRNNGGGFLNTAIKVTSEFIGDGILMYEVYGDGSRDVYDARRGGLATQIPMVVLINDGSASASEIVAGAIQDYNRAPLVGTTSFGKGSVQNWIPLSSDQGAIRVTIARWFTPDERQIHEIGLEPDILIELTDEDADAELDPQLDKAIAILTNNFTN